MKKIIKHVGWITTNLAICSLLVACGDNNQQIMQDYLQYEFISTYQYTVANHSIEDDMSSKFERMKHVNPSALNSIAFRWHNLAVDTCELAQTNSTSSRLNSYEKISGKSIGNEQLIEITYDDRNCLAKVYLSHWKQINNMLSLNYPNLQ